MENIFIIKPTSKSPVDEILALIKAPVDKGPLFFNGISYPIQPSKKEPHRYEVIYTAYKDPNDRAR